MRKYLFIAGVIVGVVIITIFIGKKKSSEEKLNIKFVQNVAIQNIMTVPNPKTIDDLLPPELKMDPWGTNYDCKIKFGEFIIWSAGPDKKFGKLIHGDDDMLIMEREKLSLDQKEDEIINIFKMEKSVVLAEVLLNSKNKKLEKTARDWAGLNGYVIVDKIDLKEWLRELREN